jgi:hypothetical protein
MLQWLLATPCCGEKQQLLQVKVANVQWQEEPRVPYAVKAWLMQ